ncbi:MAG: TIGR04255 family protein [Motiliproteus sp.]
MTWIFQGHEYTVFNRNPLRETNIEIRFHPILSITDNREKLSKFQDLMREDFPVFEEGSVRTVSVDEIQNGTVQVDDKKVFSFSKKDKSQKVSLTDRSILISTKDHLDRNQVTIALTQAQIFFEGVYGNFDLQRIGVRYINVINLSEISEFLGEKVHWKDLVDESYVSQPRQLEDICNTATRTEVRSDVKDGIGQLYLQYGLNLSQHSEHSDEFIIDLDRYTENVDGADIYATSMEFIQDIYCLFVDMAGPKLVEWMKR